MKQQRSGSHSVHDLQVHLVWSTKYRYHVLTGDVQLRCRELLRQTAPAARLQCARRSDSERGCQQGSYPFAGVVLALVGCQRVGAPVERPQCEVVADRVSRVETPILGRSFLGDRVWGLECRSYHRGSPGVVFGSS